MAEPRLTYGVGCAILANQSSAEFVFKRICPSDYAVTEVRSQRTDRKPFCRWFVTFIRLLPGASYAGGENARNVFRELCYIQPTDASVHQKMIVVNPPSFGIVYGVRCRCTKDFDMNTTFNLKPYNSQSGNYTAQSGNYTSNSGNYPTQSGNYTAQSDNYTAQCGNYTAQSDNYTSHSGSYPTQSGNYTAQSDNYTAQCGNYTAQSGNYIPQCGNYAAQSVMTASSITNIVKDETRTLIKSEIIGVDSDSE